MSWRSWSWYLLSCRHTVHYRILAGNSLDGEADRFLERLRGTGSESAQDGLDLGECLFDRREVRRVGREEEQRAVAGLKGLANAGGC